MGLTGAPHRRWPSVAGHFIREGSHQSTQRLVVHTYCLNQRLQVKHFITHGVAYSWIKPGLARSDFSPTVKTVSVMICFGALNKSKGGRKASTVHNENRQICAHCVQKITLLLPLLFSDMPWSLILAAVQLTNIYATAN